MSHTGNFKFFRLAFALAVGLVACLIAWLLMPESSLLLGLVPMLCSALAYALLDKGSGKSVGVEELAPSTPDRFQPVLHAAGLGAWVWDADNGRFECTDEVFRMLGYENPVDGFSIDDFKEHVFRDDKVAFEKAVDGVVSGQRRSPFDCRFVRDDHRLLWVEVTMCLMETEPSGPRITGALWDVTERKSEETALDRGSAYLEAILESTDDMVCSIDRQYRLTIVNQRFLAEMRAAYGVSLHVGDDLTETASKEIVDTWKPRFDRVLEGDSIRLQDAFVVREKWYFFDVSLKPIRESGYINGVAIYGRNITRQRQRESELRRAKEQAVESDRLKSAFLANMSHEIRTPLNAVMGFAQLLKSDSLTEEENERFIEVILSNGNHLLHILGDIIDLAQIESGQLRIEPGPCDLSLLMVETYSVFKDRIRSAADDLIELSIENDLSGADYIVCDQTRLKQIVYNLVSNAIKFTLKGSIRVGYKRLDPERLEFFVADTGSGILPEMKERVFHRFRQGSDHVGRQNDGVGLGLSICEGLVKLLGGDIWVEDNHPHGSIFRFTIADHSSSSPDMSLSDVSVSRESAPALKEAVRCKILVAEDDDTNYLVIEEYLRIENIEAVRAVNGLEAVEKLKHDQDIGLVVMDISMPVMDGLTATRQIKEMRPELPVVAHTAHAMQNELDQALEAGCVDCLVKPISRKKFLEILERFA